MTTAAVDVLGFLPGPVSKNNAGAADLLAGELFAYAVSSGVAVVDVSIVIHAAKIGRCVSVHRSSCLGLQVHRMQLTCVLHGGHKSASTTAVSWCAMAKV